MNIPMTVEAHTTPAADPAPGAVLVGLLAVADRVMELAGQLLARPAPGAAPEPPEFGWYRDRDGDIWRKTPSGWQLHLQHGAPADGTIAWGWTDGHVRDYAPFVPVAAR
ncbi:hypothetical protein [Nocardia wallacei]|uniref:hypothetical protein n=1 Tax=Nocardia TaxID=1817 RepID=UPI0024587242|nr:hypothetical protein [Nocardia wallacei]